MKMAKATPEDFEACFEITRILGDLEKGYYPHPHQGEEEAEANPDPVWFDEDDKRHLRFFYDRMMAATEKANINRVIFGYQVAMDNDVFDPDSDTLEWHPTLREAVEKRAASPENAIDDESPPR